MHRWADGLPYEQGIREQKREKNKYNENGGKEESLVIRIQRKGWKELKKQSEVKRERDKSERHTVQEPETTTYCNNISTLQGEGRSHCECWTMCRQYTCTKSVYLFKWEYFKYDCTVSGLALSRTESWVAENKHFRTLFLAGERAGHKAVARENLLHSYTRHAGRKSRYKQQHIARRMHQLSVAACPSLGDTRKPRVLTVPTPSSIATGRRSQRRRLT
jgi:hypothetical protein